jgi:hypothetical protein
MGNKKSRQTASVVNENMDPETSFTIVFPEETVALIKDITPYLVYYDQWKRALYEYETYDGVGFIEDAEMRLVMYIVLTLWSGDITVSDGKWVVTPKDTMECITKFINTMIAHTSSLLHGIDSIHYLLCAYPITVLSTVCHLPQWYAYIVAENLKSVIRKRHLYDLDLSYQLYNNIDTTVPLAGAPNSPLLEHELDAIFRYLGTRRRIYVNVLLKALYEFACDISVLTNTIVSSDHIKRVIMSSWIHILMIGSD